MTPEHKRKSIEKLITRKKALIRRHERRGVQLLKDAQVIKNQIDKLEDEVAELQVDLDSE